MHTMNADHAQIRSGCPPQRRWTRLLLRAADKLFAGQSPESESLHAWVREHRHGATTMLDLLVRPLDPLSQRDGADAWVVASDLRTGFAVNPVAIGDADGNLVCAWESPADQAIRMVLLRDGRPSAPVRVDSGEAAVGRRNPRITRSVAGGVIVRWDQGSDARFARLFGADGAALSDEVRLSVRQQHAHNAA